MQIKMLWAIRLIISGFVPRREENNSKAILSEYTGLCYTDILGRKNTSYAPCKRWTSVRTTAILMHSVYLTIHGVHVTDCTRAVHMQLERHQIRFYMFSLPLSLWGAHKKYVCFVRYHRIASSYVCLNMSDCSSKIHISWKRERTNKRKIILSRARKWRRNLILKNQLIVFLVRHLIGFPCSKK